MFLKSINTLIRDWRNDIKSYFINAEIFEYTFQVEISGLACRTLFELGITKAKQRK